MDDLRVRALNSAAVRSGARYVLYWAQMNRRVEHNHALAFAASLANSLDLPLLYYEGLGYRYPHANDRLHTFLLEGVPENRKRVRALGAGYLFYLRRNEADPGDVLYRLAADAAAVVTDDYPVFVTARHNARVPAKVPVPYFAVDASCIVPMSAIPSRQYGAYTIRPKIRKLLDRYLAPVQPVRLARRFRGSPGEWHTEVAAAEIPRLVAACAIDHTVPPSRTFRGGALEAEARLELFLDANLSRYARHRNEPSEHATSRLSPYLHFGQISALEVALAVRAHAQRHKLIADEFLEELIVRRELGFNFARFTGRTDSLDELPEWARRTLAEHAGDPRPALYTREDFVEARTHDALWNATQKEMLVHGVIHAYYRMYWGKKIIEWSASPAEALATMIHIHDRWALDGRDPNTYANILWCFGLHDRPWPERPVFGKVRYMSFDGMRRKTDVDAYIREMEAR
ncbi:MAG TPA: deoxyribodipyrimidine photo-lyase [Bryobacteraceae bacterium]